MKKLCAVLLICSAILTACGAGRPADSGAHQAHVYKPTLDVKVEVHGNKATVNVITDLHISPEHYGLARKDGEGHIHMYLDDGDKIGVKEAKKVFPNLPVGKHSLKVSLHNNDHTPYDVTKTVDFEIK
jgi:predicted small secreted protein